MNRDAIFVGQHLADAPGVVQPEYGDTVSYSPILMDLLLAYGFEDTVARTVIALSK
jgi:hypothetical protein